MCCYFTKCTEPCTICTQKKICSHKLRLCSLYNLLKHNKCSDFQLEKKKKIPFIYIETLWVGVLPVSNNPEFLATTCHATHNTHKNIQNILVTTQQLLGNNPTLKCNNKSGKKSIYNISTSPLRNAIDFHWLIFTYTPEAFQRSVLEEGEKWQIGLIRSFSEIMR